MFTEAGGGKNTCLEFSFLVTEEEMLNLDVNKLLEEVALLGAPAVQQKRSTEIRERTLTESEREALCLPWLPSRCSSWGTSSGAR